MGSFICVHGSLFLSFFLSFFLSLSLSLSLSPCMHVSVYKCMFMGIYISSKYGLCTLELIILLSALLPVEPYHMLVVAVDNNRDSVNIIPTLLLCWRVNVFRRVLSPFPVAAHPPIVCWTHSCHTSAKLN